MKKEKVNVVYSMTLTGDEFNSECNLAFYDIVENNKFYDVRYYGTCKVASFKTLEEAKDYILARSEYVLDKRDIRVKREIYKLASALKRLEDAYVGG